MRRFLMRLAARPRLSSRTMRWRLTVVYGGLFLVCGAGLLAITYALVEHATAGTFSYTDSNGRAVAGKVGPSPAASATPGNLQVSSDGTTTQTTLTPQQAQAVDRKVRALAASQHAHVMHQLLSHSGIALAVMAAVSVVLGWVVAGRALRPLRTITDATNDISATNLHQRLALAGPDDELKRLGDTIDSLLARLEKAFEAQRRFVANASHELRTPLTVARALLQMTLTDPDATVETFRMTCEEALAEGTHQERLIEALLVLARSERGLDCREPVDLALVAEEIVQSRAGDADRSAVECRPALASARLDGDTRLIERLVANLVDNALRHNCRGGHVEVETGMRAGRAFLAVRNTGGVIPAEEVSRLTEPFQRLGADSIDHGDGLGLGLSIVAAIAEAHGATLGVRARPGGGLEVTVDFPAASVPAAAPRIAALTYG